LAVNPPDKMTALRYIYEQKVDPTREGRKKNNGQCPTNSGVLDRIYQHQNPVAEGTHKKHQNHQQQKTKALVRFGFIHPHKKQQGNNTHEKQHRLG
jgi:hypothetical protein